MHKNHHRRKPEDSQPSLLSRIPAGVYWTLLTVLVLGLVLGYDRREQQEAKDHVTIARELEESGKYKLAVEQYQLALDNERFSRKRRGEVALRMADLYLDKLQNPERAFYYFGRARYLSPKSTEEPEVRDRILKAQALSKKRVGNTQTAFAAGEMQGGPVIAHVRGEEIHAGEINAVLKSNTEYQSVINHRDSEGLGELLNAYLDRAVVYLAALDAGIGDDPDILEKVNAYRRNLISEKYLQQDFESHQPTEDEIKNYYQKNRASYEIPGRVSIGIIKCTSQDSADKALDALRNGTSFQDVATSYSVDELTSRSKGILGYLSEKDETIPGLGRVPEIFGALMKMRPNQVTKVIEHQGAFYIFKVINIVPGRTIGLNEVRTAIVHTLQQKSAKAREKANSDLHEKFGAKLQPDAVSQYWMYVAAKSNQMTTATSTASTSGTKAATKSTTTGVVRD
jgi:tetratricopeptide (TPR) repeat protein